MTLPPVVTDAELSAQTPKIIATTSTPAKAYIFLWPCLTQLLVWYVGGAGFAGWRERFLFAFVNSYLFLLNKNQDSPASRTTTKPKPTNNCWFRKNPPPATRSPDSKRNGRAQQRTIARTTNAPEVDSLMCQCSFIGRESRSGEDWRRILKCVYHRDESLAQPSPCSRSRFSSFHSAQQLPGRRKRGISGCERPRSVPYLEPAIFR